MSIRSLIPSDSSATITVQKAKTIASTYIRHHRTLVPMGHRRSSGFIGTSWFSWFLKVGLVGLVVFARVTFQDKAEAPPSNLFCISECGTCPVICSPPPPPLLTYSPPSSPALPRSPPPEAPHSPPPAASHSPSPLYFTYPPPLPKTPVSPPPPQPPPPTPSTYSSGVAPPPPSKSYNTPPSGSAQPTVISGPHEYSYPYYYFYASDASSPCGHAPFLLLLLFLHRVFFCW